MGEALIATAGRASASPSSTPTSTAGSPQTATALEGPQLRFGDSTASRWYERWSRPLKPARARVGAALPLRAGLLRRGRLRHSRTRTDGLRCTSTSEQPAEQGRAAPCSRAARLLHDA